MDEFCNSKFWDVNLTWNTSSPSFTFCFEETVMLWVPLIFILIFGCFTIYRNWKNTIAKDIPRCSFLSCLHIAIFIGFILITISPIFDVDEELPSLRLPIAASFSRIFSFTFAFCVMAYLRLRGIYFTWTPILYWAICLVTEGILFRSAIIHFQKYEDEIPKRKAYNIRLLIFPLVVVQNAVNILGSLYPFCTTKEPNNNDGYNTHIITLFNFWMDTIFWKSFRKDELQLKKFELKAAYGYTDKNDSFDKPDTQVAQFNAIRHFFTIFGKQFAISGLQRILQELLAFAGPEVLRVMIIHFTETKTDRTWKDYFYVFLLILSLIVRNIFGLFYWKNVTGISIKCRSMLHSIVIQKALRISTSQQKGSVQSTLFNILGSDSQKLCDIIPLLHTLWIAPLQTIVATYLLYNLLGFSAFAGLLTICVMILLTGILMWQLRHLQLEQMRSKDVRVNTVTETIASLKAIKLHAWNEVFQNKISSSRIPEIKTLRRALARISCMVTAFTVAPVAVLLIVLVMKLEMNGESVSADVIFSALSVINIITVPLLTVPSLATLLAQTSISIKRVNSFLNSEEILEHCGYLQPASDNATSFKNAYLSWDKKGSFLKNIHFEIPKGSLVAIIGVSGSGKSSLLQALLGNMHITHGTVSIQGTLSYVSETAWSRRTTIKENILFYRPWDKRAYLGALQACDLETDLDALPEGDDTGLTDNGLNLSGGQRQRISLARAAYSSSDIYVMDNPLSALDAKTTHRVYEKLLSHCGLLGNKTRIVVTTYQELIKEADIVIEMENLRIKNIGRPNYIRNQNLIIEDNTENVEDTSRSEIGDRSSLDGKKPICMPQRPQKMIYVHEGGIHYLIIGMVLIVGSVVSYTLSNIWLSLLSSQDEKEQLRYVTRNVAIYGSMGFLQAILLLLGCHFLFKFCICASKNLHELLMKRILHGDLSYLNALGIGSLLNVVSKDVDILESSVAQNSQGTVLNFLLILSALFTTSFATPILLLFVVPIGIAYYFLQRFYVVTSTNLRRNESVTRTPLYSLVMESVSGMCIIKAFGKEEETMNEIQKCLHENNKAYFLYMAGTLWIKARLDILGTLIVLGTSIFAVLSKSTLSAATIALSLSSALQITQLLNYFVKLTSEFESNLVAVERVTNTAQIPQEIENNDEKGNEFWPQNGELVIQELQVHYDPTGPPILQIPRLVIESGERIGVVGRTGAGKSSLLMSIFRLIEASNGIITLSGMNISKLSLNQLRSKIAIVPQDPTFFSETMRFNLDPQQIYTDSEIWEALELANLKEFISLLPHGLYYRVTPDETKITSGYKQLICLTRAILKKPKFLVLDEVTASCDKNTENLIQNIVRERFKESTVLIVAHRVRTLLECDRVMILEGGQIKNIDTVNNLLNSKSDFYEMVNADGCLKIVT